MIKIKVKNKKAILLPEVLKIIIAVVCIVLLIYLAVKIYGILTVSSDLEKARATLSAIAGKASVVSEGETLSYLLTGPKTWRMIPYGKDLCICPEAASSAEQQAICKSQGACSTFPLDVFLVGPPICISSGTSKDPSLPNCITLINVPKEITITKHSTAILLSTNDYVTFTASTGTQKTEVKMVTYPTPKYGLPNWKIFTRIFGTQKTFQIDFSPSIQIKNNLEQNTYLILEDSSDYIKINENRLGEVAEVGRILPDGSVWFIPVIFDLHWTLAAGTTISDKERIQFRPSGGAAYGYLYLTSIKVNYEEIKNAINQ